MNPGYPIDVVAATGAQARELNAYGSNKHKCHIFTAWPVSYSLPNPSFPTRQQSELLNSNEAFLIKIRNTFDDPVEVGDEFTIALGPDGIGVILVWKC